MVGLPVRGKSVTAIKLRENLRYDSIKTRTFNNGELRREMISDNTSYATFYDPENEESAAIREKIALINIKRAQNYLKKGGNVAILDATNVSIARRRKIQNLLNDHPILFIECINNDKEILNASFFPNKNIMSSLSITFARTSFAASLSGQPGTAESSSVCRGSASKTAPERL